MRSAFSVRLSTMLALMAAFTMLASTMLAFSVAHAAEPTDGAASEVGAAEQKQVDKQPAPREEDPLLAARFAAVDGRFEACARLADKARRLPTAVWHAHQVYATCEVFAADEVRTEISADAYTERIGKAVDAFQFLLNTPGVIVASDRRRSIQFMVAELQKKIARANE
ncbi:MAG: hypothetical protein AAGG72_02575 [Pseudomonadota bacterium]